ncbi:MAG: hypothetical protein ABW104_16575 [Candidatus Thiodiazotropha sp. 6PLUC2]
MIQKRVIEVWGISDRSYNLRSVRQGSTFNKIAKIEQQGSLDEVKRNPG